MKKEIPMRKEVRKVAKLAVQYLEMLLRRWCIPLPVGLLPVGLRRSVLHRPPRLQHRAARPRQQEEEDRAHHQVVPNSGLIIQQDDAALRGHCPPPLPVQLQPRLHRPDGGALRIPSAPPPRRGAGAAAGGHGASGGVHERPVMVRASQDASLNIA